MKPTLVASATLALALALPATAATTLVDAWQAAAAHDPQFAAAQAEYAAGQTRHDQARSLLMPQIVGVASTGRASLDNATQGAQFTTPAMGTSDQVDFRTSIHHGTLNQWSLQARMPLLDAGALAQSRQLDASARLAEARHRQALQALILRTAEAYFGVLLARDTLATLETQQRAVDNTRKEALARFRVGDVPVTDSLEAEAQAQDMAARVLAARSDLQLKQQAYRDLTGLDPDALAHIDTAREAGVPGIEPLERWRALATDASPLVEMGTLDENVARYEIEKYRAWKSPTLSLVGSVGSDRLSGNGSYGPSTVSTRNNMIGVQLTIPIFTGGYRSARLAEALHQQEQAGHILEATRQWVAHEAEGAWLGVTLGSQRVSALREALKASQARLRATEVGHRVGDRTTLDVLNAQNALAQTRLALIGAQAELMMSRLRLQAAAGRLDVRELRALDALLH